MKSKILVAVAVVSALAAIGSASALGWMYRRVRAFEKEHKVSIVTPAPAPEGLAKADAALERGKVYEGDDECLSYVVKEGDDIVSIAIRFGVSPSSIADCNEISVSSPLNAGYVIKLPQNAQVTDSSFGAGRVNVASADGTNSVSPEGSADVKKTVPPDGVAAAPKWL